MAQIMEPQLPQTSRRQRDLVATPQRRPVQVAAGLAAEHQIVLPHSICPLA
jgi:hypothetical protein